MAETFALITGGGTAGHTLPGVAVAQELVERGRDPATIHFVGSEHGTETRLVPEAGFALTTLPGRGVERKLSKQSLAAAGGLTRAAAQAQGLIRRHHPAVVLSLGGFASAACGVAAGMRRVPLVVTEQNAVAGAANRLIGRFASACAVAFPDTGLPREVVTGNPVRAEILAVDRDADRARTRAALGIEPDRFSVLAFGGSLGARRINRAVAGLADAWREDDRVAIRHVVGERDWELGDCRRDEMDGSDGLRYQPVRYEDDMAAALVAADLVIGRAGATTVAELAVLGRAAVLVPLPIATADHQTANAEALVGVGAAIRVRDDEFDTPRLLAALEPLREDDSRVAAMGAAALTLGRRDAAARVADLLEEHAR